MSAGIVCVNPRVNIYRKFRFFQAFKPSSFFPLPSSLPSLYNTDATGHDIRSQDSRGKKQETRKKRRKFFYN